MGSADDFYRDFKSGYRTKATTSYRTGAIDPRDQDQNGQETSLVELGASPVEAHSGDWLAHGPAPAASVYRTPRPVILSRSYAVNRQF